MNVYLLNGKRMQTRESAYDHIAQVMRFPEYFGRNLDALYDMLTERSAKVLLKNADSLLNALGAYGCEMLKCFCDAAEANANFSFRVK